MMVRFLHGSLILLFIVSGLLGQQKRIKELPLQTMPDSTDYLVIEDMSADTTKKVYIKDMNYRFVDKFNNQTGIGGNKTVTGLWTFSQDSLSLNGIWYDLPNSILASGFLQVDANGNLTWATPPSSSIDTAAAYHWLNTHTFDSTVVLNDGTTFNGNMNINNLAEFKTGSELKLPLDSTYTALKEGYLFYNDSRDKIGYTITGGVETYLLKENLDSGKVFIGSDGGVATGTAISGDATITDAGVVSVVDDSHNHTGTSISGLATSDITSGTFGVGVGGLGNTSFTNENLIYYSAGLGYFVDWTDKDNVLLVSTSFAGGDITSGTYNSLVIADDSHNHTTTTISGLSTADITSGTFGVGVGGLGNTSFTNDYLIYYSSGLGYFVSWIDKDNVLTTSSSWTGGDLGGTGLAATVTDDSHNHTTTTISGLSTADITSGTLGVGRGGLGNTSFTDDRLIYYSSGLGYFVSWVDKDDVARLSARNTFTDKNTYSDSVAVNEAFIMTDEFINAWETFDDADADSTIDVTGMRNCAFSAPGANRTLKTINGGYDGKEIRIMNPSGTYTLTIVETGNIIIPGIAYILSQYDNFTFVYYAATSKWIAVTDPNN